jgi:hypothetical protein
MTNRSQDSISAKFVVGALSVFSFAEQAQGQGEQALAASATSNAVSTRLDDFEFAPSTAALCQRIEAELISYGEIPDSDKHRPEVILSCFKSARCAVHAVVNLSSEDLVDKRVAEIVARGDLEINWSKIDNPEIGRSPLVRTAFEQLLAEKRFDEIQPANVYQLLQQHHQSNELSSKMKEYALAYIEDRLSAKSIRLTDCDLPAELFTDKEFVSLIGPFVPSKPSVEEVRVLKSFMPSPEALVELLVTHSVEPIVALRTLSNEHMIEPMLSEVAELVKRSPAEAIKAAIESGSDVILNNQEMRNSVLDAVAMDARIAPDLHRLFHTDLARSDARRAVGRYLSNQATVARVMREVREDLSALTRYPKDILQAPEIRHAALERVNWMALYNIKLSGGPKQLRVLVEKYSNDLPDLVSLIRSTEDLDSCGDLLSQIILVNPRANQHMARHMTSVPADYTVMLGKVVAALEALGISGIGRFHNAREIIINRYHAGTADERRAIDALLGNEPSYTTGALSLRSDPKMDRRPVCVVSLCEPESDFNKAFNARENFDGRDDLDQLTTAYKVVYFEPSSKDEALNDIIRASLQLERKVDLLFLGGHGCCDGMTISCGIRAVASGQERLGREHKGDLEALGAVLADGAKVPLLSCSIASSVDGEPSFAQVLHEALPHVSVYGPDRDTDGRLLFDRTGVFKEILFSRANRIAFLAHTEQPVVEAGPSEFLDQVRYLSGLAYENPLTTAWFAGYSALLFASLYDYLGGASRSLRRWLRGKFFKNSELP